MIDKRNVLVMVLVLMTATLFSGCDRQWSGTVKGTITDNETEEAIPGVLVKLHSEKHGYEVSSLTNSDGVYRISDARWGPNEVEVYHPRYENVKKYVDVIRDETVELDFEIDRLTEYVDPNLMVTIVNINGDPVNAAVIDLYELKESSYDYYFFLSTAKTDESGIAEILLPRVYEDEIIEFQLRIAALGYDNDVTDFVVAFGNPDPEITVVLEAI